MSLKRAVMVAALVVCAMLPLHAAGAYTLQEAKDIFDILDTNHDGKVTRLEFETNKIDAFYFRTTRKDEQDPRLRYEETGLSRAFFDHADQGHKGYLTGLDLVDAIRFEMIDQHHRGYFDLNDLVAGLKSIGR
jgi:Ca2+-binding EF-hand superfamily protein